MGRCLPPPAPVLTRAARCSVNLQAALHLRFSAPMTAAQAKLWLQKWRWYERNTLPWNRARIHWEMARREAFVRWPVHGNVLEALLEGRLEVGAGTLFEPGVWITAPGDARVRIGEGSFLNLNVMVASVELVEIGSHCMFANGCFVTDGNHRFDDRDRPVTWQGFTTKGPTRVGDNVWCGANVVITSGVTIGERCVIGANSVVTADIPAGSIAAGSPRPRPPCERRPRRASAGARWLLGDDDVDAEDHAGEGEGGHGAQDDVGRRPLGARSARRWSAARVAPRMSVAKAIETPTPASAPAQTSSKSWPQSIAAVVMRRP